jgi:hypothetical protein
LIDADKALTEHTFSMGTKPAIEFFAQYVKTKYDYWELNPITDLKLRGFKNDASVIVTDKEHNFDYDTEKFNFRADAIKLY